MSDRNLEYWQKKLSKLPVLELTTDKLRSPDRDNRVGIEAFVFSQELCQSIKTINRQFETTFFTTLLAAFKCLLYRYTTQEDIIVGSYIPQSNYLFNTLPFRTNISGNIPFSEFLKQLDRVVTEDLKHQDFSWSQLVKKLSITNKQNKSSIFQVMFSLLDTSRSDIALAIDIEEFKLDLSFVLVESQQGLKGTVTYNQELFEPQTMKRAIAHFNNLLEAVIENPACKVNELKILSEIERD